MLDAVCLGDICFVNISVVVVVVVAVVIAVGCRVHVSVRVLFMLGLNLVLCLFLLHFFVFVGDCCLFVPPAVSVFLVVPLIPAVPRTKSLALIMLAR